MDSFNPNGLFKSNGLAVLLKTNSQIVKTLSVSLATLLLAVSANAEKAENNDKTGVSGGLNLMVSETPYDLDDSNITILPSLFFDNDRFYARGNQVGGYFVKTKQDEVAIFLKPTGYSFNPDDAKGNFKRLDERELSGMIGASYMRSTPIGAFRGRIAADVLGKSDGLSADLAYLARLDKGKWTIYPSIGVELTNDKYNEYYFGVSNSESNKTGINAYKPDADITPYVNINANYKINEDWALFLGQKVSYLSDEIADSPMVENRTTYRSTLGVLYYF